MDFIGAQGAAISDFASLGTFDHFANFSSSGEFKFGTDWANFSIEESDEFVIVRDGTSREIADQSSVALGGFLSSQDGIDTFFFLFNGRSLSTSSSNSSEEGSLEDGNTTKEIQ